MGFTEPDVSKLKLKKNTFRFIQLKKYEPKKHFLIKKSQKTPLQEIIDSLLKPKKNITQASLQKKFSLKDFVFSHKYLIGAFLVAFIVFLFIIISSFGKPQITQFYSPKETAIFSGELDTKVLDSGIISFGSLLSPSYQPFLVLEYSPRNLSNLSLNAYFYPSQPSRQVFVLDSYKDGADTYPEFRKKLENYLKKNGWVINDISINDLYDIPEGCTLLIPTGYLPAKLLGEKHFPSIVDLASRGIVIIYLGQPFDENVFDEFGNLQKPTPEQIKNLNIKFEKKVGLSSTEGFSMVSPYYSASFGEGAPNILWGSISVISLNKGYLLFLPQALDGGWGGNSDLAAKDVGNLIINEPYRLFLSTVTYSLNASNSNKLSLFFNQTSQKFGVARIIFTMTDKQNLTKKIFFDWPLTTSSNSGIYMDEQVFIPTYLGGTKKTITLVLNETPVEDVKLFFQVYKNGEMVDSFPVEQGLTKTVVTRSAPISFSLQPGDYLLKVIDSKGKFYAASKIEIIPININITGNDKRLFTAFKEGRFNISFSSYSKPLTVPYVKIYIENKKNARIAEFKNVNQLVYETNTNFERGTYSFIFDFNGYQQKINLEFAAAQNMWERTDVQILGLVAILSFGFVAYVFIRPKKDIFSLDIPDFPFQEYKQIKLSSQQVLSVFDIINKEFKWEGMPLSLSEIKNGFLKLTYDGHPIVIGEYNLEEILQKLETKKLVASNLNFWIPTSWIDKSTNIKKITLYRYLRDIFVNNAIKFSKLKSLQSENYEIKILVNNTVYFLFLFDGTYSFTKKIIQQTHVGQCWVIFENQQEINEFLEYISSTISKQSILLKLYLHNGKIKLVSLEDFEKLIQSIKVR